MELIWERIAEVIAVRSLVKHSPTTVPHSHPFCLTTEPTKEATKEMSTETSATPAESIKVTPYATPKKKPGRPRKNAVEAETKPAEVIADKPVTAPAVQEEKPAAQPETEKRPGF